ncbi:MAG: DUF4386 domain-containing protein [Candidatus Eisenbacteria bacterium]|nr:DUF4386 domain-containing protein [Candidatus Eisenbacteria bacterium]
MDSTRSIRAGGWSLILGAISFMVVFAFLAARFDYPAVLDGPASTVLPKLLATGSTGRAVWAIYAFLPLVWIPAGVGAYHALRHTHPGAMFLALHTAIIAALSMMLGLMRWPSIHWQLAEHYTSADAIERSTIGTLFDGLNSYLGNYVGEFLGELSFSTFFLLSAWALLRSRAVPRWLAVVGFFTGVAGLVGMFRNVTSAVDMVAAVNNYLLPIWMIGLGIILLRWPPRAAPAAGA